MFCTDGFFARHFLFFPLFFLVLRGSLSVSSRQPQKTYVFHDIAIGSLCHVFCGCVARAHAQEPPASFSSLLLVWCNLNLKIISSGNRTRDFTVVGRYNYRYAVHFIKLDESIHGVTVVIPTNDREILGSTPGRYNLQIENTSTSWILADEVCAVWY